MDRRQIRILFLFFLLYLPVQYGLVGLVSLTHSEPWPAFLFPGFKSVHNFESGTYTISELQIHAWEEDAASPIVISPRELFSGIPLSQSQGFLRTHFADSRQAAELGTDARQWLREEVSAIRPDVYPHRIDLVWLENRYFVERRSDGPQATRETGRLTLTFQP